MPDPCVERLAHDPLRARSAAAFRAFSLYLRWYIGRNFEAVRLSRAGVPSIPAGRPVIVCSNHPGWWDPALFILLQSTLMPERIGFGPMDQAALSRYGVLRKMGIFGIDPGSRAGAAGFMRNGLRILSDPRSVLWITAEGAFTDVRVRPVALRAGIAHLARRVPQAVILPLALEYTFWNERFPVALAYFGQPVQADPAASIAGLTAVLEAALARTMDALATESLTRDPAHFHTLLRGRAGVGGIYDLWRHGVALVRGDRFDPHHVAVEQEPER